MANASDESSENENDKDWLKAAMMGGARLDFEEEEEFFDTD